MSKRFENGDSHLDYLLDLSVALNKIERVRFERENDNEMRSVSTSDISICKCCGGRFNQILNVREDKKK